MILPILQIRPSNSPTGLFSIALLLWLAICCASVTAQKTDLAQNETGDHNEPTKQTGGATTTPTSNSPQSEDPLSPLFPKWEVPIIKGVAESGLAIVSLGFAAFTFLYGGLLALKGDAGVQMLRTKLRRALYGTAVSVILAAALSVVAFVSIALQRPVLGFVAIALAILVLVLLSGITGYLAWGVYRGSRTP